MPACFFIDRPIVNHYLALYFWTNSAFPFSAESVSLSN